MSELPPSASAAGLRGRRPKCGKGALFHHAIVLRENRSARGLDHSFAGAGDGPAIFAISILGFVVLGGALIAEFKFSAPVWFHIIAWALTTPLLAVGLTRVLKGLLIAQQFATTAEQGRFK